MKEKNSLTARLLCLTFCLFIGGGLLWNLLTPDRSFSPMENRMLAEKPEFTWRRLFDGEYTADVEAWLTDQFAGRDAWVGIKYYSERALLKTENNGVYFADGGRLIERLDAPVEGRLERNVQAVAGLGAATGLPVHFSLIPTAAWVYRDDLPANAPCWDQQQLLDAAGAAGGYFDLSALLYEIRDLPAFYRTDHHWTTAGAFAAYEVIARELGLEPLPLPDNGVTVPDFYGTLYSQAGARGYEPDEIVYYPMDGLTLAADGEQKPLYDESYITEKDKYSLFMGGNYALCVVKNQQNPGGGRLLLIKDSFSNSLAPFLARHFSEIHMVDPRYYRMPMSAYTAENDIDRVLVLYQTKNFLQDSSIELVAR